MTISPGGEASRVGVAEQRALDLLAGRRCLDDHLWVVAPGVLDCALSSSSGAAPCAIPTLEPSRAGFTQTGCAEGLGPLPPAVLARLAEIHLGDPGAPSSRLKTSLSRQSAEDSTSEPT